MSFRAGFALLVVIGFLLVAVAPGSAHPEHRSHDESPLPAHASETMRAFVEDQQEPSTLGAAGPATCTSGSAAGYQCSNVDLVASMPLADIGGRSNSKANDIWGWTDPVTGSEYAIIGTTFGTSFVNISVTPPRYLGELPTHGAFGSSWRDVKVYENHAYIVSEARGHGMQVFDLRQLRGLEGPVTFAETAHYSGNATAHNIVINEDSGYAYIVGANGKNSCSGGLHMVDLKPDSGPAFAGCYSADGYTHDAQCVTYDTVPAKEICFNSNEDALTIVDVTDKADPVMLSQVGYEGSGYVHQGWLTEDRQHFLIDDEMDERNFHHKTRTRVFDVSDLRNPRFTGHFDSTSTAIDHNQYVKDGYTYQANYRAGLRILRLDDIATASPLSQVGFFDIYPADDAAEFNGAWSVYPYFASGMVVVSGIEQGLFILQPNLPTVDTGPFVTIGSPAVGATVSGDVAITATASDDVSEVQFLVNGELIATDTVADGWSATWDSDGTNPAYADGLYTISAVVTVGTETARDDVGVTLDNEPTPTVHVHDLDGSSTVPAKNGRWDAIVTVTVHDAGGGLVNGATVNGYWSDGATGSASCVTGVGGTCTVTVSNIHRNTTSVTFTVDGITADGLAYSGENHDLDGDSTGTVIVVTKP